VPSPALSGKRSMRGVSCNPLARTQAAMVSGIDGSAIA